jgi:hypothetical protein
MPLLTRPALAPTRRATLVNPAALSICRPDQFLLRNGLAFEIPAVISHEKLATEGWVVIYAGCFDYMALFHWIALEGSPLESILLEVASDSPVPENQLTWSSEPSAKSSVIISVLKPQEVSDAKARIVACIIIISFAGLQ